METFNKFFGCNWDRHENNVNDGAFKTFINDTRKVVASDKMAPDYLQSVSWFMSNMRISGDLDKRISQKSTKMIKAWNDLLDSHEMLKIVDWYSVRDSKAPMLINYINALAVQ
jgi:hypothetical protein